MTTVDACIKRYDAFTAVDHYGRALNSRTTRAPRSPGS